MKEFIYLVFAGEQTNKDDKKFYFTENVWLIMWKKKIKTRKLIYVIPHEIINLGKYYTQAYV